MDTQERSLSLRAEVTELAAVADAVGVEAAAAGLSPRRRQHLDLAVEEAFVNVCRYAYDGEPGPLVLRLRRRPGEVRVAFIDEGGAFDPLATEDPEPGAALADRRAGGMGIFLMRRLTDELHYRRETSRNVLEIVVRDDS